MKVSVVLAAMAALLLSVSVSVSAQSYRTAVNVQAPSALAVQRLQSIDHFIVIMLENESFDQLFPNYPGAENLLDWMLGRSMNKIPYKQQTDMSGNVLQSMPVPQCAGLPCGNFPASLPNSPYLGSAYWPENATSSFDVVHRYWQEQWQINGGAMDRYVTWGATSKYNGLIQPTGTAWAMQYWNVTSQYMGQLGMNFTVFDAFFHSYFGGSTPGAVSVFAGDLPMYNGSNTGCPVSLQALFNGSAPTADGSNFTQDGILDGNCRMINDCFAPGFGPGSSVFLPTNQPTIVDLLDAKNVSWAWYAQNWNNAYAGRPYNYSSTHFAYHHHAPLYYQRFANNFTSPDFTSHMLDETLFFNALNTSSGLPSVSYVRPSPDDDMHPAQNNPVLAQAHLKAYFDAIFASQYWLSNKTAVLITFDENGGYFDHVAPYVGDADGPGTRVPSLMISPYHTNGGVNHYPYEGLSFLKMMQTRYNLSSNTIAPQRVNTVRDLTNSFAEPAYAPSSASSSSSSSSSGMPSAMSAGSSAGSSSSAGSLSSSAAKSSSSTGASSSSSSSSGGKSSSMSTASSSSTGLASLSSSIFSLFSSSSTAGAPGSTTSSASAAFVASAGVLAASLALSVLMVVA